jgi:RNA polymerase sigma-70 factor (ECF subfamily)
VESILNHLKKNEREIHVLRYLEDFTLEDVAKTLGIPEGTVKSRLSRVINKIRSRHRDEKIKIFER